jgi:hypothetical protein
MGRLPVTAGTARSTTPRGNGDRLTSGSGGAPLHSLHDTLPTQPFLRRAATAGTLSTPAGTLSTPRAGGGATPRKTTAWLATAHGEFLDRLEELASRKAVNRRQWEALASLQPALASKMSEQAGGEGGTPDEKLHALVLQEKERRKQQAVEAARARQERRRAAIAAREEAQHKAAAPAAAALRCALRDSTYKLPELERVLEELARLERPPTIVASEREKQQRQRWEAEEKKKAEGKAESKAEADTRQRSRQKLASRGGAAGGGGGSTARRTAISATTESSSSRTSVAGKAWGEYGGSGGGDGAATLKRRQDESERIIMEEATSAVFVHFIPPPLRADGKRDLPWIVHTCNGVDGCREARRVSFHSVTGFGTYESAPPEVAEGLACSCQIANHHLRGYGKVRWEGEHAIIEDDSTAASVNVDGRLYLQRAKKLAMQLKALKHKAEQLEQAPGTGPGVVLGSRGEIMCGECDRQHEREGPQVAGAEPEPEPGGKARARARRSATATTSSSTTTRTSDDADVSC